ncbi:MULTISPECIES: type II toxin-antitoxin system RelE/ParE family toxin [Bosea]|uniref:type II toxin-antitoxin system RelE/ParE family toxin n=1 Tax=Bosea TaxID=85413 RepID=UPI0009E87675|nr:type II toxin-antitoxin system RelE/ParE family toxin [Bosea vaviloviae]
MREIVISPAAQRDIDDIWTSSIAEWGSARTIKYVTALRDTVARLAEMPEIAPACDHVKAGHRKYGVGSHIIFFTATPDQIDIVRILHQRMDVGRHLT